MIFSLDKLGHYTTYNLMNDRFYYLSRLSRITGFAAGDEVSRYGVWFSPFYSKSIQKSKAGLSAYKGESCGGSFGIDTKVNESLVVGAVFTAAGSKIKPNGFEYVDKTTLGSLLFSIYGMQELSDYWFVQGIAIVGVNKVKNNKNRYSHVSSSDYDVVNDKYTLVSFSGKTIVGYNYIIDQATLSPIGGWSYTRVNGSNYKVSGSTNGQNFDVSSKALNRLEAIIGVRVELSNMDFNGISVTPEIHGFINHDLIGKRAKQSTRMSGTGELATNNAKLESTTLNIGLGVNVVYNAMEYGVNYDSTMANKYTGHQGRLKVRLNF
jgi:outer membrane autotransporter protein